MNRSLKIFSACALGAFIGTIVALGVNKYFWWVGLAVGGFTGYLFWNIQKIPGALKKTYEIAIGWRIPMLYWKSLGLGFIVALVIVPDMLSVPTFLLLAFSPFPFSLLIKALLFYLAIGIPPVSLLASVMIYENAKKDQQKAFSGILKMFQEYNLLSGYCIFLPKRVILPAAKELWWYFKRILMIAINIVIIMGRFTKTFLIIIYSDILLLCVTGAIMGTGIGYLSGSFLVGTLTGGILGLLNYEIVSKRIVKVNLSKI